MRSFENTLFVVEGVFLYFMTPQPVVVALQSKGLE
jgi:hypothetical protein